MDRRRFLNLSATTAAAVQLSGRGLIVGARADDAWPGRQISMIVPFPPGGQADFAARPVAEALGHILGVPVTVENRAGAGGALGNTAVARAAPDGYKVLMTLSSLAVLVEAQKLFGIAPSYSVEMLVPIARVLADPAVLSVHKAQPHRTIQEFIADAKARPGQITFASSGNYGTTHVPMEMLSRAAGIKLQHVPYRGAGPAMNDVIAGQINCLAAAPATTKPQKQAGNIRTLASFGAERVAAFPDVPTFREIGFPEAEYYIWAGLFAPQGTPQPVVDRLRAAMREVMADPKVVQIFAGVGSPPAYLDAPEFAAFVATDSERLIKAVRAIGKVGGTLE